MQIDLQELPFNLLYKLNDGRFNFPNQFITLWKYIIYFNVCKLTRNNAGIDPRGAEALHKAFPSTTHAPLRQFIQRWSGSTIEVSVALLGAVKFGRGHPVESERDWVAGTEELEEFIRTYIDDSTYFISFDELDDDYGDLARRSESAEYLHLMTSLFKAVQDVCATFPNPTNGIGPIVFLRDDIYDQLLDTDKAKWQDLKIELEWDEHSIKRMLAFRISRALDRSGRIIQFEDAWSRVFERAGVPFGDGQKQRIPIFDYVARSTLLRPRDFIQYMKICAEREFKNGNEKIRSWTVRDEDKRFSNYLFTELKSEISGASQNIEKIFRAISHLHKQTFSIEEFRLTYEAIQTDSRYDLDWNYVLTILFHFSIIGNVGRQKGVHIFKYKNREATFNFSENIVVHRGLFKALQII